ncbi:MAG: ATP-binding protein [Thermoleophilia bacterium]
MTESFAPQRTSWIVYLIALTGLVINAVYFGFEFVGVEDPVGHFTSNLTEHITILSLILIFPLPAFLAERVMVGHHLNERSRLLELEVAARTKELEDLKIFSENIMASVNDMIFVIGSNGCFQFISGNSRKVLGFDPDALMGRQFSDLVAAGSVATAVSNFEKIMWGDDVSAYELEVTDAGNEIRCIEIASTPFREGDRVIAQVGVAREVTERKRLEKHIQERNRELAALNQVAHAVGQSLALDQVLGGALQLIINLLSADRGWVHLYDPETDELALQVWKGVGQVADIVKSSGRLKMGEGFTGLVASRNSSMFANVDDLEDGRAEAFSRAGFESVAAVPMTVVGRLVGVLGVASQERDHFSKADLDLLRVASSQVAMSVENATLFENLKNKTAELEAQNQELAEATGRIGNLITTAERSRSFAVRYDNSSLVQCWEVKNCSYAECPSYESRNLRCWQVAGTHCGGEVQGVFAQKFGKCEQCDVYKLARTDRIAALGETFNNMMAMMEQKAEEQQQLQEQLLQSTKLAAIGELAANIAHEINNPLTGVLGFAALLRRDCPADDPKARGLEIIENETLRARDIVRNLLDFARQDGLNKRKVAIREVVEDTLPLLRKQAELSNVVVRLKCSDDVPVVYVDVNQMKQVFINILNNALHAMPAGGAITIDVHAQKPDGHKPLVEVSFTDTGSGIAADKLERVFDPFFTSKAAGEGTGLGLSVSQRIVEEHGGAIEVRSTQGVGSTFTIKLPTASLATGIRRVA